MDKCKIFTSTLTNNSIMKTLRTLVCTSLVIFAFNAQALMLNLKNTDIKTFINTVAMATGKNFLVDPRVKGVVNIIGNKEISDEELYNIFLTVLKAYGYAVIEGESLSRIVPKNLVKAESAYVSSTANDAIITKILSLNNIDGNKIIPIIRPLMSPHGLLSYYNVSNSIIVIDTTSNIKRLEDIIAQLDKPLSDDFDFITLKHAAASNISTIIKTLMGDKAPALTVNKNSNQLIISGSESKKLQVRLLVNELDKETAETGSTAIVYLKNASAKDILPILQNISNFTTNEKTEKGETVVKSNIQADEATNSIIVTGDNETKQMVKSIIERLDVRRAQVLIEAIIAEVRSSDSERLGIEWIANENNLVGLTNLGGAIGSAISGVTSSTTGAGVLTTALSGGGLNLGTGNYNEDTQQGFAAIISALNGTGNTNILSAPSVLTLDNQEAEIVVGEEVPFITNSQVTSNGNPFQNIERKDVGLKLTVKPQINNGDSIKLEIAQENSNVSASSAASDVITSKRSIKTTVIVEDGKILVLGGLMDDSITGQKTKVPLLGDIPILGTLFSYETEAKEKRNLMVFIRPTILKNEILAEELSMEKYQSIKAEQLLQNKGFDMDALLAQ